MNGYMRLRKGKFMNLYDVESKDQKIIGIGADGKQKVYRKPKLVASERDLIMASDSRPGRLCSRRRLDHGLNFASTLGCLGGSARFSCRVIFPCSEHSLCGAFGELRHYNCSKAEPQT